VSFFESHRDPDTDALLEILSRVDARLAELQVVRRVDEILVADCRLDLAPIIEECEAIRDAADRHQAWIDANRGQWAEEQAIRSAERAVRDEQDRVGMARALEFACPYCLAAVDEPCRSRSGALLSEHRVEQDGQLVLVPGSHADRRRAVFGLPPHVPRPED
jgi:hypothetical protein